MSTNNQLTSLIIKVAVVLFIITISIPARIINQLFYSGSEAGRLRTILVCVLLGVSVSSTVMAQRLKDFANKHQLGFEASFGVRSFTLYSNLTALNNMHVMEDGGSVGITAGGNTIQFKIKQGYYYSSSSVANSVDVVKSAMVINLYPLHFFTKKDIRFQPYFMAGLERNVFKMYGFYNQENASEPINYSIFEAPYLGKILSIQASVGAGLEYTVKKPGHFVRLFGEAKYGRPFKNNAVDLFKATTLSDQVAFHLGIGFGYYR